MATFLPHFRLANHMGANEFNWPVNSVEDLMAKGNSEFGELFSEEMKAATILVNGRAISYLQGESTTLSEGDNVSTVLPSAGG